MSSKAQTITFPVGLSLQAMEHMAIRATMVLTKGNRQSAARLLGLHQRTIGRKLLEMEPEHVEAMNAKIRQAIVHG